MEGYLARELSLSEIFQLGYYWETKILLTAIRLDLFSVLDGKELTLSQLARRMKANERALGLLVNALVAIGVLQKDADRVANTTVASTYLVRSSPEYVGHLLVLHDAEWNKWGELENTIRTGRSPVSRHVFEADPELGANVLAVLHRVGQQSGPALAQRLGLDDVRSMLDLGGGAGTNAIAFCTTYPRLTATVFDLPSTLKVAERTIKEAGLDSRIALLPGDFHTDPLGGPYDVVLMSDILHYQDPDQNAALVRKVLTHLTDGGRLVIKDRFLDQSGTSPAWTTAFAVHILVNTARGRCYTVSEARHWMEQAGFELVEELGQTAVIQGSKRV